MIFNFNSDDPVIKELLLYANNDESLLEYAMHLAFENRINKESVTIQSIKEHIDKL
jgi:hypothetical protein